MTKQEVAPDPKCLNDLEEELQRARDCHYDCARWFSMLDGTLIWMSAGLAALVSASIFADATTLSPQARIVIGSLSALGGVALAIQQNLKYSDRAKGHKQTGSKYAALFYDFQAKRLQMTQRQLGNILAARKRISMKAPLIPAFIRNRHVKPEVGTGASFGTPTPAH